MRWLALVLLVLAGSLAAVALPLLVVWILAADLLINLWRYLWR